MSSTQSQGTSIAFRTSQPEQFHKTMSRPLSAVDSFSPAFTDKSTPDLLKRFGEQCGAPCAAERAL
jgi:hypothetical protein